MIFQKSIRFSSLTSLLFTSAIVIQAIFAPTAKAGQTTTQWTIRADVFCYDRITGYPWGKVDFYWKSYSTGLPPYPIVSSQFYAFLSRKDSQGRVTDVGYDDGYGYGNAGEAKLRADSFVNANGTYRVLEAV